MATMSTKSSPPVQTSGVATSYGPALAVLTTLFFIWGSLTSLNDVLIPFAQHAFTLNLAQSMLIQTAFFLAYFIISLPAAKIIDWIGYKKTMVGGLFIGLCESFSSSYISSQYSDLIVFGKRAGEYAATWARDHGQLRLDDGAVERAVKESLAPFERGDHAENPYKVQADIQDTMQDLVGIVRLESEMQEALVFLAERVRTLQLDGQPEFGTPSGIYGLDTLPLRLELA